MDKPLKKRRHRRSVDMYPLVEAYIESDMSREAFCQTHAISVSALGYWQTKYRKAHRESKAENPQGFISLDVSAETGGSVLMELVLPGGSFVRFYRYPEAQYVATLMSIDRC
ncbi:MAG: hypothetical protein R3B93_28810 [Bacteroidia bacterium]